MNVYFGFGERFLNFSRWHSKLSFLDKGARNDRKPWLCEVALKELKLHCHHGWTLLTASVYAPVLNGKEKGVANR
eukprot:4292457-Amphidinium_carterae.1